MRWSERLRDWLLKVPMWIILSSAAGILSVLQRFGETSGTCVQGTGPGLIRMVNPRLDLLSKHPTQAGLWSGLYSAGQQTFACLLPVPLPVAGTRADKPFEPTNCSLVLGLLQLSRLINSWSDNTLESEGVSCNLTAAIFAEGVDLRWLTSSSLRAWSRELVVGSESARPDHC